MVCECVLCIYIYISLSPIDRQPYYYLMKKTAMHILQGRVKFCVVIMASGIKGMMKKRYKSHSYPHAIQQFI